MNKYMLLIIVVVHECSKRKLLLFFYRNNSSHTCLIKCKPWHLRRNYGEDINTFFFHFPSLNIFSKKKKEYLNELCMATQCKFGQTLPLPYFYFHSNRSTYHLWCLGDRAGQEEWTTIKLQLHESRSNQTCLGDFLELINCTMLRWALGD